MRPGPVVGPHTPLSPEVAVTLPMPSTLVLEPHRLTRLLDDTLSIRRRATRPRLHEELGRLTQLMEFAGLAPLGFREVLGPRRAELEQWLYGVALGVAAAGLAHEALGLLDVLPGVAAGSDGRRALLIELIASRDAHLDLAEAS
jgi:hypothetical protein